MSIYFNIDAEKFETDFSHSEMMLLQNIITEIDNQNFEKEFENKEPNPEKEEELRIKLKEEIIRCFLDYLRKNTDTLSGHHLEDIDKIENTLFEY